MNLLMQAMPSRCFDVGIAEGHAVTFSAGLAAAGIHLISLTESLYGRIRY